MSPHQVLDDSTKQDIRSKVDAAVLALIEEGHPVQVGGTGAVQVAGGTWHDMGQYLGQYRKQGVLQGEFGDAGAHQGAIPSAGRQYRWAVQAARYIRKQGIPFKGDDAAAG